MNRYAEKVGVRFLIDSGRNLFQGLIDGPPRGYERRAAVLMPFLLRLGDVLRSVYDHAGLKRLMLAVDSLSTTEALTYRSLNLEKRALDADTTLSADDRRGKYLRLAHDFNTLGFPSSEASSLWGVAVSYQGVGEDDRYVDFGRKAIQKFREADNHTMTCQALGQMGSHWRSLGEIDSMKAYYDAALDIAHWHRMPQQAARITSFYASYVASLGRTALAHHMYQQAIDLCRDYKGGFYELRFVVALMRMHAELGVWEAVGNMRAHGKAIMRLQKPTAPEVRNVWTLRLRRLNMRYLMAVGRFDEARREFDEIRQPMKEVQLSDYIELLWRFADGLCEGGSPGDALPIIDDALALSSGTNDSLFMPHLYLTQATAHYKLRDAASAWRSIADFEETAPDRSELRREWARRDVLRVQLAFAERDTTRASRELGDALGQLERFLVSTDASFHGYMILRVRDELRHLLHDIVRDDDELGYGVEFYWRGLYRLLGAGPRGDAIGEHILTSPDRSVPVLSTAREHALRARAANAGAVHLVYAIHRDEVWRWTCGPGGITREALAMPPADLAALAGETWEMLANDPGDASLPPAPVLVRNLTELGAILLPPGVLANTNKRSTLRISTEGFLMRFPFETLNIGSSGTYVPLLQEHDVVYVRHVNPPKAVSEKREARGVAIADPTLSCSQAVRPLPASSAEAASAANPTSVICGDGATRARVMTAMSEAEVLYLATHICHAPDSPYSWLIPLAPSPDDVGPDANYLDVLDIRSRDMSDCHLAVLSGCSSAAPFIGQAGAAPTLVDAFLDAGVANVVQTFWDIRDDMAKASMARFLAEPGYAAQPVKVLCDTRRAMMGSKNEVRHPFYWAAYSIKTAGSSKPSQRPLGPSD
ncbi:MAG: CHAT domain-containing protein [Candidatus Krumholzibacteriia bacterium]